MKIPSEFRFRLGVFLMVASFVPFFLILAVPLLTVVESIETKGFIASTLFVVAEIWFWGGLLMAGKDVWQTVKAKGWKKAPAVLFQLLICGRSSKGGPPISPGA